MIHINLVPEKIRSGETLKVIVALGVVSLVIPILFWGWRYQGVKAQLKAEQASLDAINAELNSPELKSVVAEVAQFSVEQADLTSKRSIVDALRQRQVVVLRFLDLLPDLFPPDGKVKRLEIVDKNGVKNITMICDFLSQEGTATVYDNLEASSEVDGIEMTDGPKSTQIAGRTMLEVTYKFTLKATQ